MISVFQATVEGWKEWIGKTNHWLRENTKRKGGEVKKTGKRVQEGVANIKSDGSLCVLWSSSADIKCFSIICLVYVQWIFHPSVLFLAVPLEQLKSSRTQNNSRHAS